MRSIDKIAIRSAKPMAAAELRTASLSTDERIDQRRAHIIDLARWLADVEEQGRTLGTLRASEQREYDRRNRVINDVLTPPTTLSRHAAQLRLLGRK